MRADRRGLSSTLVQLRYRATLLSAALMLAVLVAAGCGDSSPAAKPTPPGSSSAWAGSVANPPHAAAPIVLRNWDGQRIDLADYRGKAVLVTFIYDHCPDVCPLIVGNLHSAQEKLGAAAGKLRIVAVSVDPRGDTPKTVRAFLREHQMLGRMDYLIGRRPQLRHVWKSWGVLAEADPESPDAVEHSAMIYGVSASGKVTTLYPSDFKPSDIVHDVPRLAAQ